MSQIYTSTKSFHPTKTGLNRKWYLIDASTMSLGRLSTIVARLLMGKNRADYNPGVDMGACVIVINAKQLVLTGKKMEKKVYFRHEDGRIGALKHRTMAQQMAKDCKKPIYLSIRGMLPKNRLKDVRMNTRLHIFEENHSFGTNIQELITL